MPHSERTIYPEPPLDTKIWRYVDLAKFLAMLDTRTLHFARADQLGDPFEGSYSSYNIESRPEVYDSRIPDHALRQVADAAERQVRFTFINSWHTNDFESAALWDLYADRGIAIQSTFSRLKDSLAVYDLEPINFGIVQYIDYQTQWLPEGNLYYPYIHKRKSFEHEKELRAVILRLWRSQDDEEEGEASRVTLRRLPLDHQLSGIPVPVDVDILVEALFVHPQTPDWFRDVIGSVTERFGLLREIQRSGLRDDPVY